MSPSSRHCRCWSGLAEQARVRWLGEVPQPDRAVEAAAGKGVPVGAERHRVHGEGEVAGLGLAELAEQAALRRVGKVPQ
jgi:hypothetical protein